MKIFKIAVICANSATIDRSTRVRSNDLTISSTFNTDWDADGYGLSTVDRAIQKIYGTRCFFQQNQGLPQGYGQVFKPCRGGGSASVTGVIQVMVAVGLDAAEKAKEQS